VSVGLSVGRCVTVESPAKTAELIDMPFVLRTWVCPRNHVSDGGADHSTKRGNFGEGKPTVKYRDYLA